MTTKRSQRRKSSNTIRTILRKQHSQSSERSKTHWNSSNMTLSNPSNMNPNHSGTISVVRIIRWVIRILISFVRFGAGNSLYYPARLSTKWSRKNSLVVRHGTVLLNCTRLLASKGKQLVITAVARYSTLSHWVLLPIAKPLVSSSAASYYP